MMLYHEKKFMFLNKVLVPLASATNFFFLFSTAKILVGGSS